MNELKSIVSKYYKEYIVLTIGLIIQILFGSALIKYITNNSCRLNVVIDNKKDIILMSSGYIVGGIFILYIAYLFVKKRSNKPIKNLIKFVFIYIAVQILSAIIIGSLYEVITNEDLLFIVSIAKGYIIRYLFLAYVFIVLAKDKKDVKKQNIAIGLLVGVIIIIALNLINMIMTINVVIELLLIVTTILFLHLETSEVIR